MYELPFRICHFKRGISPGQRNQALLRESVWERVVLGVRHRMFGYSRADQRSKMVMIYEDDAFHLRVVMEGAASTVV